MAACGNGIENKKIQHTGRTAGIHLDSVAGIGDILIVDTTLTNKNRKEIDMQISQSLKTTLANLMARLNGIDADADTLKTNLADLPGVPGADGGNAPADRTVGTCPSCKMTWVVQPKDISRDGITCANSDCKFTSKADDFDLRTMKQDQDRGSRQASSFAPVRRATAPTMPTTPPAPTQEADFLIQYRKRGIVILEPGKPNHWSGEAFHAATGRSTVPVVTNPMVGLKPGYGPGPVVELKPRPAPPKPSKIFLPQNRT